MITEKKTKTVSVRMDPADYELLDYLAYNAGLTVSEYIRILCAASVNGVKKAIREGKVTDEDLKAVQRN